MKPPRVQLLGSTINTKTTDNHPAFLALMKVNDGVPFLSVSSAQTRLDVQLDLATLEAFYAALKKLLEVAP